MLFALCLGLFLPLLGFLFLVSFNRMIKRRACGIVACSTILISFLCFVSLLFLFLKSGMHDETFLLFKWIHVDRINADFTLHIDALSILMTLIITGIGFLIHVYSNGYMEHDEDYVRYFAFMNFFIFSMLLLVLAGDLLVLFVGWEGVGLASYLLIGFWYEKSSATEAATKAFVMNRIGDLGLLLGLLLTYYLFGTSQIEDFSKLAVQQFTVGAPLITLLTLLYFIGATGKSAQIPLYTWLPDAMEGPTPVSALIHAATMVTAGVYLVVRMHTVFMHAPDTLMLVGIIGGVTALYASLCALGQTDLKRVLAYSTVSQIGLMFLACGAGAFYSAMFHLTTHAFIKALLFLSAGNVLHMLHNTTDMGQMGGLSKKLTLTNWFFLIGVLALSGIPPLAAFFSKDLILEQEYLAGLETLYYVGLTASILTGFYLTRAYCLTFLGKPKDKTLYETAKEAPSIMLLPVGLLAILSITGGFLGFEFGSIPILGRFLVEIGVSRAEQELSHGFLFTPEMVMAILGAFVGVFLSFYMYTSYADRLGGTISFLRRSFYIDEIYDYGIVRPLKKVAAMINDRIEPKIFDRSIDLVAQGTQGISSWLQGMESGQIRSYVSWMLLGIVMLILYFVKAI